MLARQLGRVQQGLAGAIRIAFFPCPCDPHTALRHCPAAGAVHRRHELPWGVPGVLRRLLCPQGGRRHSLHHQREPAGRVRRGTAHLPGQQREGVVAGLPLPGQLERTTLGDTQSEGCKTCMGGRDWQVMLSSCLPQPCRPPVPQPRRICCCARCRSVQSQWLAGPPPPAQTSPAALATAATLVSTSKTAGAAAGQAAPTEPAVHGPAGMGWLPPVRMLPGPSHLHLYAGASLCLASSWTSAFQVRWQVPCIMQPTCTAPHCHVHQSTNWYKLAVATACMELK